MRSSVDVLALRAAEPALRHGATTAIGADGPAMAIERRLDDDRLILALNPGRRSRRSSQVTVDDVGPGWLEPVSLAGPTRAATRSASRTVEPGSRSPPRTARGAARRARRRLTVAASGAAYTSRPVADLPVRPGDRARRTSGPGPGCRGQDPAGDRGAGSGGGARRRRRRWIRGSARSAARCTRRSRLARRLERPGHVRCARRVGRRRRRAVVGVPRSRLDRHRPRRPGSSDPVAGSSSSTTTGATTWPSCGRRDPSTASGRDATARSSGHGFKIRVLHCWWTFDSLDEAQDVPRRGIRRGRTCGRRTVDPAAAVIQRRGLPSDARRGARMTDRRATRDPYARPHRRGLATPTTMPATTTDTIRPMVVGVVSRPA